MTVYVHRHAGIGFQQATLVNTGNAQLTYDVWMSDWRDKTNHLVEMEIRFTEINET